MVNVFPLYVTSTVQDWFFSLEEGARRNLQSLKEAFLERFQRRNLDYSLQNIKQQQSEAVDDYINRILAQTADSKVPEAILVGMMVGGLRPDLAAIVMPQAPKTHQQFLAAATIAEKTVQMTTTKLIENLTVQIANIASMEDRLSAMLTDKLNSSVAEMSALQVNNNSQTNRPYQRQQYQQRPHSTYRQQQNYQRPPVSSCQGCGNLWKISDKCAKICSLEINLGLDRCIKSCALPANSEIVLPVHVSRIQGEQVLLEPTPNLEKKQLMGARCIVTVIQGKSVFRIINPTNKTVQLPRRYVLANAVNVDEQFMQSLDNAKMKSINTIEAKPKNTNRDNLEIDLSKAELTLKQKSKLQAFLHENKNVFATNLKE
ncbi:unnamed protein product [Mytilus coruscus]|uniref:Retrotransposon gag domain-containing protein n=1 Tax=Mytilus coruscus TaxID=42192 RepID=A0A6J8A7Q1_MYTCO|nr:unnamed protein product [Mytilus coruscus]